MLLGFVEVETAAAFAGPPGAEIQEGSNRVASLNVIVMCREIGRILGSPKGLASEKRELDPTATTVLDAIFVAFGRYFLE